MINAKKKAFGVFLMITSLLVLATIASAQEEVETRDYLNYTRSGPENTPDFLNSGSLLAAQVLSVEVNGVMVENGDTIRQSFERGDELEVSINMQSNEANSDV
jgi:hypothetical protein